MMLYCRVCLGEASQATNAALHLQAPNLRPAEVRLPARGQGGGVPSGVARGQHSI